MPDTKQYLNPETAARISSLELRARLIVEGYISGLHRSPYRGFSVEFAEHRPYNPGDELRAIDWRVFARTDRYYVKQYEEETNLLCWLALDSSASMGFSGEGRPSKHTYALSLAAALALLMLRQGDAVGAVGYDMAPRTWLPPRSRPGWFHEVLRTLASSTPSGETGTATSLYRLAERLRRRGLVVVISDFLDDPAQVATALRRLRHERHEVLAVQVLDPLERSFEFEGNLTFRDMETGRELATQPSEVRRAYAERMENFIDQIRRECRRNEIDHLLVDTATPFDVALAAYLNKRKRAR